MSDELADLRAKYAELQAKFDRHIGHMNTMHDAFVELRKENDGLRRELDSLRFGDTPLVVEAR